MHMLSSVAKSEEGGREGERGSCLQGKFWQEKGFCKNTQHGINAACTWLTWMHIYMENCVHKFYATFGEVLYRGKAISMKILWWKCMYVRRNYCINSFNLSRTNAAAWCLVMGHHDWLASVFVTVFFRIFLLPGCYM